MDGYLILVYLNRGNVMIYSHVLEINITEVLGRISFAVAVILDDMIDTIRSDILQIYHKIIYC